jgi:NADH-quinone oxidoreductase subunit A
MLTSEYFFIILYIAIGGILAVLMFVLATLLSPREPYMEKISAYECGFDPFDDARMKFEVHFYLIAILFLLFDLEVAFLFPWVITISSYSIATTSNVFYVMFFLLILLLGLIYE